MTDPRAFIGDPIPFLDICTIYPPKIKDAVSNERSILLNLLVYSQEDIEDLIKEQSKKQGNQQNSSEEKATPTPFEFLLINSYYSSDFLEKIKDAFMLFTHSEILINYEQKMIIFGGIEDINKAKKIEDIKFLNENNFPSFQNHIRLSLGSEIENYEDLSKLDPITRRVREAARRREHIAKKSKNKKGISLATSLAAICCMGIGITPLNIGEMSYAAFNTLIPMMQEKEKYEIDIRSIIGGADPKKVKPKYWIKDNDGYQNIEI